MATPASENTAGTDGPLTIDDLNAVQEVVPGIAASSPVTQLSDRVPVGNGKEKDVTILGVNPEYVIASLDTVLKNVRGKSSDSRGRMTTVPPETNVGKRFAYEPSK